MTFRVLLHLLFLSGVIVVACPGTQEAWAAEKLWTGAGGDHLWTTPQNWMGGVPGAVDQADFFSSASVSLGGTRTVTALLVSHTGADVRLSDGLLQTNVVSAFGSSGVILHANLASTGATLGFFQGLDVDGAVGDGAGGGNFGIVINNSLLPGLRFLPGYVHTYMGPTTLRDGELFVDGATIPNCSRFDLSGTLAVGDTGAVPNSNHIRDDAVISFVNGRLELLGGAEYHERVGALQLARGGGSMGPRTITSAAKLLASSFQRQPGTILINAFAEGRLTFDTPPTLLGPSGPGQRGILLGVYADQFLFTTYDKGNDPGDPSDDVGVRTLRPNETVVGIPPGESNTNAVVSGSNTVTAAAAINSLFCADATSILLNNATLTVNSGAIGGTHLILGSSPTLTIDAVGKQARLIVPGEAIISARISAINAPFSADTLTVTAGTTTLANSANHIARDVFVMGGATLVSSTSGALGSTARVHVDLASLVFGGSQTLAAGMELLDRSDIYFPADATLIAEGPIDLVGRVSFTGGVLRLNGSGTASGLDAVAALNTLEINGTITNASQDNSQLHSHARVLGTGRLDIFVTGDQLEPGQAGGGIGTLRFRTYLSGSAESSMLFDIAGTQPGIEYDQLIATGGPSLSGNSIQTQLILDIAPTFHPSPGQTFTLINIVDPFSFISGRFTGLPDGAVFTADGNTFRIGYFQGTGNDVVLTVLPEPEAAVVLLFVCALRQRRRRK